MNLLSITLIIFYISGFAFAGYISGLQTNLAVYWGQNSAHSSTSQDRLSAYCREPNINIIMLSFLVAINLPNGQPELNFANQGGSCNRTSQPWTCSEIEKDINECQSNGKTILLSFGGDSSQDHGFVDETAAKQAAEKIWQMFGPDQRTSGIVRPFGKASVDGFDFDFEHDMPNVAPFGNALREQMQKNPGGHGKPFYLTAAPQCPLDNSPKVQSDLLDNVHFDMVFVQFYNNPSCDVTKGFNFQAWNEWAKSKNSTFFVGLPADPSAATAGGYLPPGDLNSNLGKAKKHDLMRGAMLWDASQAWKNGMYHEKVKSALNITAAARKRWDAR